MSKLQQSGQQIVRLTRSNYHRISSAKIIAFVKQKVDPVNQIGLVPQT